MDDDPLVVYKMLILEESKVPDGHKHSFFLFCRGYEETDEREAW